MSKSFVRLFLLVCILPMAGACYAQYPELKPPFPTYEQLKNSGQLNYNFVNQQGKSELRRAMTIKLFGYPPKSVLYILNNKSTRNARYAKRVVSKKNVLIEHVAINENIETKDKIIRIDYYQPSIR